METPASPERLDVEERLDNVSGPNAPAVRMGRRRPSRATSRLALTALVAVTFGAMGPRAVAAAAPPQPPPAPPGGVLQVPPPTATPTGGVLQVPQRTGALSIDLAGPDTLPYSAAVVYGITVQSYGAAQSVDLEINVSDARWLQITSIYGTSGGFTCRIVGTATRPTGEQRMVAECLSPGLAAGASGTILVGTATPSSKPAGTPGGPTTSWGYPQLGAVATGGQNASVYKTVVVGP